MVMQGFCDLFAGMRFLLGWCWQLRSSSRRCLVDSILIKARTPVTAESGTSCDLAETYLLLYLAVKGSATFAFSCVARSKVYVPVLLVTFRWLEVAAGGQFSPLAPGISSPATDQGNLSWEQSDVFPVSG